MIPEIIHCNFLRVSSRVLLMMVLILAPVVRGAAQTPIDPDVVRRTLWFH